MEQRSQSLGHSNDYQVQDGTSAQEEFGNLTSVANNFAQKYGVSNQQAVAMLGSAGLGADIPLTKIGAQIKAQFGNSDIMQKAWEEAQQINTNTNFSDRYQSLTSATQTEAAKISESTNDSLAREVSTGLAEQTQYRGDIQSALRDVQQWQEAQSSVNEQGFTFSGKLEAAVKQFMINEEGRSPIEVSNVIAGHNRGNTDDTVTLANSVSHFAEKHGLNLAGIQSAQSYDTVVNEGDSRMQRHTDLSQNVQSTSDNNNSLIFRESSSSGIPQSESIRDNVTFVMNQSISDMNATTNIMDKGASKTNREGDSLESLINEKQDTYSVGAAPSIHEAMDKVKKKLTNTFKDAFD